MQILQLPKKIISDLWSHPRFDRSLRIRRVLRYNSRMCCYRCIILPRVGCYNSNSSSRVGCYRCNNFFYINCCRRSSCLKASSISFGWFTIFLYNDRGVTRVNYPARLQLYFIKSHWGNKVGLEGSWSLYALRCFIVWVWVRLHR